MTPCLDAIIPINHQGRIKDYNTKIRDYVPPEHKSFLEYLDHVTSLRLLIINSNSNILIEKYNQFINAYTEQRSKHIQVVLWYCIML